tara:strand:- start:38443 stop:38922 length:480 start_codon:yes stop_codon:yes gene_type:complete
VVKGFLTAAPPFFAIWYDQLLDMKIGNTGPINVIPARQRDRAAQTSSSFSKQISNDTPVVATSHAGEVASLTSLLSVQEVNDPLHERQRAIKHGEDLLEELDELRHGLLIGAYPEDKLNRILAMVKAHQGNLSDPNLQEILSEIELRASVELAKLGRIA